MSIARITIMEFNDEECMAEADQLYQSIRAEYFPTQEQVINVKTGPTSRKLISLLQAKSSPCVSESITTLKHGLDSICCRSGLRHFFLCGCLSKSPWKRIGLPCCLPIPWDASTGQLPSRQLSCFRYDDSAIHHSRLRGKLGFSKPSW